MKLTRKIADLWVDYIWCWLCHVLAVIVAIIFPGGLMLLAILASHWQPGGPIGPFDYFLLLIFSVILIILNVIWTIGEDSHISPLTIGCFLLALLMIAYFLISLLLKFLSLVS
ncbi:MAG: hypothetical protein PHD51_00875 [Patescibacteria group bacterium]|nr:hypothetical protein [Patescibacteria group bacterium]MDD5490584.1 hypothetical protein [Patescibacteria group bacterium]